MQDDLADMLAWAVKQGWADPKRACIAGASYGGYAALMGGLVMGAGMLMLFRHHASLGGINIAALYLQERHGLRAGHLQLGLDVAILAALFFVVGLPALLASVGGAVALNLVIALNHRPGRYLGF